MKDTIKMELHKNFIVEGTPGISNTKKVLNQSKDINKNAQSEIKKKLGDYQDTSTGKPKDSIKPPKRELDKSEQEIADLSEKSGGIEDLNFDGGLNDKYKERQEMAIAGDSKMGNKTYTGKDNGNTEPVWGASKADFGDNLINKTKKRKEVQDKSTIPMVQFGDDIELVDGKTIGSTKKVAVENKINNKKNIMKRLKFKSLFNGMDKAISLIPEGYKVDDKEFEMTDGIETYKIKWEGSLTEGKAIILRGENKNFVNEDMNKIKHLFNYKSSETLGIVRGSSRLDEDKAFTDVWNKTKKLMSED